MHLKNSVLVLYSSTYHSKLKLTNLKFVICTLSFQERPAPADISVLSLLVHRSLVDLTELHLEEKNSLNYSKNLWVMMSRKHFV